MNSSQKGMLASFLANFIFGLSFLFSTTAFNMVKACFVGEDVLPSADVPVVLAIRFLFALIIMTALMPVFKIKLKFKGKPVWKLVLLGVFQPVIYFVGESFGLKMTGIVISSIMIALVPIICQMFSALFLKDSPNLLQVVFSIVSVLGVIFATVSGSGTKSAKTYVVGIICLVVAVISAAAFNVLGRSISQVFTAFERTYFMFIVSAVFFSVYALFAVKGNVSLVMMPFKDTSFIISILYLGGLSSVLAYFMINYANTYLPVTRATIFSNIITVVSTTAGFIAERNFNVVCAVCCVVIVIGVWGVQYFAKNQNK